jgi:hypothetical protein
MITCLNAFVKIRTTSGKVNMNTVRKEIRDLITINEKIQSALLNGDCITNDEALLIRQCASELLEKFPDRSDRLARMVPDGRDGRRQ